MLNEEGQQGRGLKGDLMNPAAASSLPGGTRPEGKPQRRNPTRAGDNGTRRESAPAAGSGLRGRVKAEPRSSVLPGLCSRAGPLGGRSHLRGFTGAPGVQGQEGKEIKEGKTGRVAR